METESTRIAAERIAPSLDAAMASSDLAKAAMMAMTPRTTAVTTAKQTLVATGSLTMVKPVMMETWTIPTAV